jgi:hypothetical protein
MPILIFCLTLLAGTVGAKERFTVKYVSAENVYLDGGLADGLNLGARLLVLSKQGKEVEIEIVYLADHSASCKIIGKGSDIQAGDAVQLQSSGVVDMAAVADSVLPEATMTVPVPRERPARSKRNGSLLSGSVSLLAFKWNDDTESDLDFSQTTARVSLKVRRLWGKNMTLSVRGRGRFDRRQRDYRSEIERGDWQNRLWEFSLSYEEPSALLNFQAGRILPRRAGSIGYLDGLLVEGLLSDRLRAGLFGGSHPDWIYDERGLNLMKGGGYISYAVGDYGGAHFEQTVGAVGEYKGQDVSREFVIIQGSIGRGSIWGVSHTGEVEINRSWRREQAGKSFELSNLYLNGWVRPGPGLRVSLSYDNRINYWTMDNRSIVDSLFDDRLRQGVRLQSDLSLPVHIFSSLSAGYRKRSGDPDPTLSYSVQVRKGDVLWRGLGLSAHYATFDGPLSRGYNYTIRATRFFGGRYTANASYGTYAYRTDGEPDYSINDWIEVSGQADVGRRYWLGLRLQKDNGDDIRGFRVQSELGYRF